LVESRALAGGIAYLRLPTFDDEGVPAAFDSALDRLDLARTKGIILDLRYNMGGDDQFAWPVLRRLIDRRVLGFTWKTREYRPALASWNQPETWFQGDTVSIEPSERPRYGGPLVVLTGPNTMSTSEDFLVALDYSGRALLVGEPTAGTTGNPVNTRLPGGGILRVCSVRCTYPDGREFVGRGIQPDVLVHPTVAGIRAGRDEVLERALEAIREWDRYQRLAVYSSAE
jgi:C-terminal processing protease CtpA/Prc